MLGGLLSQKSTSKLHPLRFGIVRYKAVKNVIPSSVDVIPSAVEESIQTDFSASFAALTPVEMTVQPVRCPFGFAQGQRLPPGKMTVGLFRRPDSSPSTALRAEGFAQALS